MKRVLAIIGSLLISTGYTHALPINSPVPDNATITFAGLQWAWGGMCQYSDCDNFGLGGDLSYQGTQGWRLPTSAELALVPANFASYFIFPGANVPNGGVDLVSGAYFVGGSPGGDAACATPYFNRGGQWCDWYNANQWAGTPGALWGYEQLYVRDVPEPASLAVIGIALAGLGRGLLRRTT